MAVGFGGAILLLNLIPFLGYLILPAGAVGGALLVDRLDPGC